MHLIRKLYSSIVYLFLGLICTFASFTLTTLPIGAQTATTGQWSPVQKWFNTAGQPVGIIHATLLPNGKVLGWTKQRDGGVGSGPQMILWTPPAFPSNTATFLNTPTPPDNLYCAGHSFLPDGRLLTTGGDVRSYVGLNVTYTYESATNIWTKLNFLMNAARWYPTNTTLGDGRILVVGGTIDGINKDNDLPQIFTDSGYISLTNARSPKFIYPWMHLRSDGRVFKSGPDRRTNSITPNGNGGTGSWSTGVDNIAGLREKGTSVMYTPDKVLIVGGGGDPQARYPNATSTVHKSAEVIDLSSTSAKWRYTKVNGTGNQTTMSVPRRHLNATILPDGKVFISGGVSGSGFNNLSTAVRFGEMWDPTTEVFTKMASISDTVVRSYHSIALLLPDGRVLSAGGGYYSSSPQNFPSAEIYAPPYLFNSDGSAAKRPLISSLSTSNVTYGMTFTANTPDATDITKVTLVKLSAVTHGINMDQRFTALSFTKNTGSVTITMNNNKNVVPPGHYMLFLLKNQVPSIANIIKVG
jgi:hypothetical protein